MSLQYRAARPIPKRRAAALRLPRCRCSTAVFFNLTPRHHRYPVRRRHRLAPLALSCRHCRALVLRRRIIQESVTTRRCAAGVALAFSSTGRMQCNTFKTSSSNVSPFLWRWRWGCGRHRRLSYCPGGNACGLLHLLFRPHRGKARRRFAARRRASTIVSMTPMGMVRSPAMSCLSWWSMRHRLVSSGSAALLDDGWKQPGELPAAPGSMGKAAFGRAPS